MCEYQGYEFGAGSYPDSLCIDGKLYDADDCDDEGRLFVSDEDIPCPVCRPLAAVAWWASRNEDFWDDDQDVDAPDADAKHSRRARDAALSMVNDIRKNRGLSGVLAKEEGK